MRAWNFCSCGFIGDGTTMSYLLLGRSFLCHENNKGDVFWPSGGVSKDIKDSLIFSLILSDFTLAETWCILVSLLGTQVSIKDNDYTCKQIIKLKFAGWPKIPLQWINTTSHYSLIFFMIWFSVVYCVGLFYSNKLFNKMVEFSFKLLILHTVRWAERHFTWAH